MSKDINLDQFKNIGKGAGGFAKRYAGFSFFVIVICVYSFLVFRISTLSRAEPSDSDVEQITATKRLRVDQSSIDKIQQLQDQNVGVQSLLEEARDNPFQE